MISLTPANHAGWLGLTAGLLGYPETSTKDSMPFKFSDTTFDRAWLRQIASRGYDPSRAALIHLHGVASMLRASRLVIRLDVVDVHIQVCTCIHTFTLWIWI